MRTQRLGCLTPTGLITALVTILLLAGAGIVRGGALFSPGGLNAHTGQETGGIKSHAELSSKCSACHTAPWDAQRMADRCLDCHTAVQADLANPATLHGALAQQPDGDNCLRCHTEHRGPQAGLTRLDIADFPHEMARFSLKGHPQRADGSPFTCQDCHEQGYTLPTNPVCADCHTRASSAYMEKHIQTFGQDCLACHDGVDRYGKDFDHNKVAFALSGKHAQVDCAGCHHNQPSSAALRNTPTDCASCHQKDDAHQGALGAGCAACHTADGWTPSTFDHNNASFKLTGAHISVTCSACHANQRFIGTPSPCFDCHAKDDPHNGQYGQECSACHATDRWSNIIFDHARSQFPLTGAHSGVPCQRCHSGGFTNTATACSACHQDPPFHAGLFPTGCAACHTTTAWLPAEYNGPHTFPLGHGDADSCRDCHTSSLNTYTCYTCHDQTEIMNEHSEEGVSNISNCVACHPTGEEDEGGDDDDD